jgi:hypothetical protein
VVVVVIAVVVATVFNTNTTYSFSLFCTCNLQLSVCLLTHDGMNLNNCYILTPCNSKKFSLLQNILYIIVPKIVTTVMI